MPVPSAQPSLVVEWTGERLTVSARDVALAEVLHEVARQTGVQFVGTERLTDPFSIEFTDKSLDDGLRELLADLDYLMALPHPAAPPSAQPVRIFVLRRAKPGSVLPDPTATEGVANNQFDPMTGAEPIGANPEGGIAAPGELPDDARDPELRRLEDSGFFDDANASALIDASNHANTAVRIRALEVLSQRDASLSADVVGNALTDANPSVSSAAAALIAENADLRAVERLGELLKHDDPAVRFGAIQLLAQRGDAASLPYVLPVTDDENPAVRMVAEQLIERLVTTHFRQ
ncbi:MAG: HEAT repeat domain-containing protein [Vicinamibacterales bacterium]